MICQFSEHAHFQTCIWKIKNGIGGGGVEGSREKEAGSPSTSWFDKNTEEERHPDSPQPMLTARTCSGWRGQKWSKLQAQPSKAGRREGARSGEERRYGDALKLKLQSRPPLGTESEPRLCPGACLIAGFTWGNPGAESLTLYRGMRALPAERGSSCGFGDE